MRINRLNYETYLADYLDSQLDPEKAAELMAFLAENPDLSCELEQMRSVWNIPQASVNVPDFSFLLKDINKIDISPANFGEFCIAYHEGDLLENKKNMLLAYISKDEKLYSLFEHYGKLKLNADPRIIFKNKKSLKHGPVVNLPVKRTLLFSSIAAAAAVAMVIALRILSTDTTEIIVTAGKQNSASGNNTKLIKESYPENLTKSKPSVEKSAESMRVSDSSSEVCKNQLAVIDTTDGGEEQYVSLAMLEAKQITIIDDTVDIAPNIPANELNTTRIPILKDIKVKSSVFIDRAGNLTVNDIIKGGISGINKMAETNIRYEAIINSKGKIIEFALKTDNFNSKRKIRNN